MPYENLTPDFEEADLELCKEDIKNVIERLPFAVNLTSKDKMGFLRMGRGTYLFVQKAIEMYRTHTNLRVDYLKLEEWENDFAVYNRLRYLQMMVKGLEERISDTLIALGKENTNAALIFYNNLKKASQFNVPGTTNMVEDLGSFFENQRKKPKKTKEAEKVEKKEEGGE